MTEKERKIRFLELLNSATQETGIEIDADERDGIFLRDLQIEKEVYKVPLTQGEYAFAFSTDHENGSDFYGISFSDKAEKKEIWENGRNFLDNIDTPPPPPKPKSNIPPAPPRELPPLTAEQIQRNQRIERMKRTREDDFTDCV